jgi:adenosylcobalamin-dependent ribonucleoside-triphosphate reductase
LHRAITLAARMNYRQTAVDFRDGVLQEAWHINNEFLRLCGVGLTGIVQRPDFTSYELKNIRNSAVCGARSMAKDLGLEHPKNVTTVKPSGTVSKIMDTTEGIHKPLGRYIFNWINFSKEDPIVKKLIQANYKCIPNPTDGTGVIACIPVDNDQIPFDKVVKVINGESVEVEVNIESALAQLERYKQYQMYYCDQNVSNTISYDPSEVPGIIDWLYTNWEHYVGVSFLFRTDPTKTARDLGYDYLPQEVVDKGTFDSYRESLLPIVWNETDSYEELEDESCATGACPIK